MTEADISAIKSRLHLCRDTWRFYWKKPIRGIKIGDQAGVLEANGYRRIMVCKKNYREHRLVWLFEYGVWPSLDIDHIDGNKNNNNPSNLRLATQSQNQQNRKKSGSGTSGYLGVTFRLDTGKYQAQIGAAGKHYTLGSYKTPEEAHCVYLEAKRKLHKFQGVPRQ